MTTNALTFVSYNRFDDGVVLRVIAATRAAGAKSRWIHVVEVVPGAGR